MLCQYNACASGLTLVEPYSELALFAGRSSAKSIKFGVSRNACETLAQIQEATAIGSRDLELATVRNLLPISILRELGAMSEVPQRCVGLLCLEIGNLSKTVANFSAKISGEPLQNLNQIFLELREQVHVTLNSKANFPDFERTERGLDQLISRTHGTSHERRSFHETTQHLHRSLKSAFDRSQFDVSLALGDQDGQDPLTAQAAADFIHFFTGCLLLYVPNRPYDPALKPMVECNRHTRRRSELENKLEALQYFELVFSGQKSNLRSQLVKDGLAKLGAEPEVPIIFRPQISELGQLQAEFNTIVQAIVLKSPSPSTLQSLIRGDSTRIQEIDLLRTNIAQAMSRLSDGFQGYEDIKEPLIGFLQGLDVGLVLSLLTGTQRNPCDHSMQYLCKMTPFLGAGLHGIVRIKTNEIPLHQSKDFDPRMHFLKYTGMARSVNNDIGEPIMQSLCQTFHSFYQEWQERLEQDQQHVAAQSSLYRYRGGEEESDEADEQDFHNLFPDYNRSYTRDIASQGPKYNARCQAQRLAGLHREMFQSTRCLSERILDLLQDASRDIASLWEDALNPPTCPIRAESLLPALVLSLDQHKEQLLGQAKAGKLYNFYSDANVPEAQKLIALVGKIQARFLDLQEDWPEHATLADVLRTSSEFLALRHVEPIAKVLTKAEQLHGFIHEWQVVASKRYTAITLYEQLTELLVSWRQLELSTWARLIDMEDEKCNEDAESWWFIAYEVIIAAPLAMIDAGEALQLHAEQLFKTLADFMGSTSIGQYAHHLGMIGCFKIHLETLVETIPSVGVVSRAVSNFLSYYARFDSPIQEFLRKGRQKLEKDMKEILLLASWNDTNINALRDSAKRSHHKLFKVVRKYRTLLAQSAETFVTQGFSEKPDVCAPSNQKEGIYEVKQLDPRAIQTCKNNLDDWESKPERFTDPTSTAQRMAQMSRLPPTAIDGAVWLDSFGSDLIDDIRNLQQEKPSEGANKNCEAIKHLKARKRKLYTETLKALRHMGFRSNLSAAALDKQSSLSVILTKTPTIPTQSHHQLSRAEFHFHRVLCIIPEIKERSRNHSEDLNHAEVSRSIGYLESMVSVILMQRIVLATSFTDFQELKQSAETMYNSWAPDSYNLKKQDKWSQSAAKGVQSAVRWLPGIIEAGAAIIQKHGKMGEIDHSAILSSLGVWKDKMTNASNTLNKLSKLPSNVSSSRHEETHDDIVELLEDFKTSLQDLTENNPGLAFVLKQIAQWTSADVASNLPEMDGEHHTTLVDLDNRISKASDSILVAMQRMRDISSTIPSSDEDATWLIRVDSSLARSLKSLHPREINELLREAMGQIQYLGAANDGEVLAAGAVIALALPLVQQLCSILQVSFDHYAKLHRALCKFSDNLAHSFLQIVQEGFCSPAKSSAAEAGGTEKMEGGTGLGEGEGAEDISKNIEDDESLSEIAQGGEKTKGEEIEDREDAVDMDHDELEGQTGDVSDKAENDGSASGDEEADVDEETGDIDDLDPSAVDEKLWDGKPEEGDKEKEKTTAKGKAEDRDQVADDAVKRQENAKVREHESEDDLDSQNGVDEAEEVAKAEAETMDLDVQDGQNLDLPEDMHLDNVNETDGESASETSDMEGMSDVEQEDAPEKEVDGFPDGSEYDGSEENAEIEADALTQHEDTPRDNDVDFDSAEDAKSPVDTEPDDETRADDHLLGDDRIHNQTVDQDKTVPSDAIGVGEDVDRDDAEDQPEDNKAQGKEGVLENPSSTSEPQTAAEDGQLGEVNRTGIGQSEADNRNASRRSQAFQKLGDALKNWHRQNKEIQEASEREANEQPLDGVHMADQEFEHLPDEEAEADTQALGAASDDQARALNNEAMDYEMHDDPRAFNPDETVEEGTRENDQSMSEANPVQMDANKQQEQHKRGTFAVGGEHNMLPVDQPDAVTLGKEKDIDDDFSTTYIRYDSKISLRSAEDARRLWSHYESLTRDLALSLTEQLRLILAPTLATRMRGDFRTGKRLNIKRIIPYIASQYKRDKIWMRRSIPSKRNYQIMLAVDDSKSMGESGSGQLAFETLALVSKSLSMLEVGEICIVGFGEEVRVAHEFDKPFSSEAGAQICQHFDFEQTRTNVRKLVAESIILFREARHKNFNAGTELWQLGLIISDGVCEDHDTIRRLVRQAQEERIMLVFIIVDALSKGESIMDMSQAVFEPDNTGETKLKIKRYLDGFPFSYYLVVGDVRELPSVLAKALRQWFAEIVESG